MFLETAIDRHGHHPVLTITLAQETGAGDDGDTNLEAKSKWCDGGAMLPAVVAGGCWIQQGTKRERERERGEGERERERET